MDAMQHSTDNLQQTTCNDHYSTDDVRQPICTLEHSVSACGAGAAHNEYTLLHRGAGTLFYLVMLLMMIWFMYPLPHLRWDWAHPRHICTGTGPTPSTSY